MNIITNPTATILITTFNEGKLIERAINSVYYQVSKYNTEIIVIDDCSEDAETINILTTKLPKEIKIYFSRENMGLSYSRNLGFNMANSDIIIPLDGDDYLPDNSLNLIIETFLQNPDIDFIFGNYSKIENKKREIIDCSSISEDGKLDCFKLAKKWILLGTSPCKKSLWNRIGGYDLTFSYTLQDVDFWMRALINDAKGLYLPDSIYVWERKPSGLNSNIPWNAYSDLKEKNHNFFTKFKCSL
ncbi:glycosyltransferase family 2 protein [Arundinibacter roseus]|uniref:Glycosyltransferase n=1 Tax=Arundinibacter roseus TaxID=2070510 RepID=A0A4R4KFB5_9BACT|nr:glycosyltransferase [Arundinibacter roseus]TDB65301.1 glycosyltransferase [Arundinibacter roseus]